MQAILIIIIGAAGAYFLLDKKFSNNTGTTTSPSHIVGCYLAHLTNDIYTLKIQSENANIVTGTLAYKNFSKDSSSGSFVGRFKNNILFGNYTFDSEGINSIRQVIFKRQGNSFIEGFGDVTVISGRETFTDPSKVTYDPNMTFTLSSTCK